VFFNDVKTKKSPALVKHVYTEDKMVGKTNKRDGRADETNPVLVNIHKIAIKRRNKKTF